MIIIFEKDSEMILKEKMMKALEWFFTIDEIQIKTPDDVAITSIFWGIDDIKANLYRRDKELYKALTTSQKKEVARALSSYLENHEAANTLIADVLPQILERFQDN